MLTSPANMPRGFESMYYVPLQNEAEFIFYY